MLVVNPMKVVQAVLGILLLWPSLSMAEMVRCAGAHIPPARNILGWSFLQGLTEAELQVSLARAALKLEAATNGGKYVDPRSPPKQEIEAQIRDLIESIKDDENTFFDRHQVPERREQLRVKLRAVVESALQNPTVLAVLTFKSAKLRGRDVCRGCVGLMIFTSDSVLKIIVPQHPDAQIQYNLGSYSRDYIRESRLTIDLNEAPLSELVQKIAEYQYRIDGPYLLSLTRQNQQFQETWLKIDLSRPAGAVN